MTRRDASGKGPERSATEEAALLSGFEIVDKPSTELMVGSAARRGRRAHRAADEVVVTLLRDEDDLCRWHFGDAEPLVRGARRRGTRRASVFEATEGMAEGEIERQYRFRREGTNKITSILMSGDAWMTPRQGLRQVERSAKASPPETEDAKHAGPWVRRESEAGQPGSWWRIGPIVPIDGAGPSLVLVHGTFSKGDMYLAEFVQSEVGARFLEDAWNRYSGRVYAFNHPTLSVGPLVNAVALARALPRPGSGRAAQVDFVAHSRGGLVARWAIDVLRPDVQARAVLVGAPLGGTNLASPERPRAALNAITSFGKALELAGSLFAVPFLAVPNMLIRAMTATTGTLARIPVFDAGIALVPGLHSMSSVQTNREIEELQQAGEPAKGRYAVISSNYESEAIGWRFWKLLRPATLKQKAVDWGADVLFPGDNDLVVDTGSMGGFLSGSPPGESRLPKGIRVLRFDPDDHVHHCAYFRDQRTVEFVRDHLGM